MQRTDFLCNCSPANKHCWISVPKNQNLSTNMKIRRSRTKLTIDDFPALREIEPSNEF